MRFFLIFLLFPLMTKAQDPDNLINPELLELAWPAKWITHPTADETAYEVLHARKSFTIPSLPDTFLIHVSADNRYRLFINGKTIGMGPARGDIWHWRFETYDITPFLMEEENLISIQVVNFGPYRPLSQHSYKTAFIIQGNTEKESVVNTGLNNDWKILKNNAFHPIKIDWRHVNGFFAAGPTDSLNAAFYPWGWKEPEFDDSRWDNAAGIGYNGSGIPHGYHRFSGNSAWKLIPRNIPFMEEKKERIPEIKSSTMKVNSSFLKGGKDLSIPSDTKIRLLLDQTYLTKGYPELHYSKGNDALIRIKYAEALIDEDGNKGNRNIVDGKYLKGYYDVILSDGGLNRRFQPLWLRTYRYIELEIETAGEELIIHDYYNVFTGYPFQKQADVSFNDKELEKIFDTGWWTLRMCADETYWDCPYYEQLQYAGDTRTQTFISQYVSGDNRLFKNALLLFDHSRLSEGITYSRYPSFIPQVTPAYSLMWINMVYDYMMLCEDPEYTATFLNGIETVLKFYEDHMDSTGMVAEIPFTNHIESRSGFPWREEQQYLAQHNLLFAYTLNHAADIFMFHEEKAKALRYRNLAEKVNLSTTAICYDPYRQLYSDTPDKKYYSQHVNTLAILSGAIQGENRAELMEKILTDTTLISSHMFFKFYIFRAMKESGLGDQYLDQIGYWRKMLDYGLTTWPEFEIESRSDCHAWSAHPTFDLLATVAGIESEAPGFRTIKIEPHMGDLDSLAVRMPHPDGFISVKLEKAGVEGIKGTIRIPSSTKGRFVWNKKAFVLTGGEQSFKFE